MKIEFASLSEKGSRSINEDYTDNCETQNKHLFCLADGLGGHGRGEIASKIAVFRSMESFKRTSSQANTNENTLAFCFERAHESLQAMQIREKGNNEIKTTLTLLLIDNNQAVWGHIGDSRLYLFRKNRLFLRTFDHSVPQMLVSLGDIKEKDIRFHEDRNRLIRVLGMDWPTPKYELSGLIKIQAQDVFLLCSDGFWEMVDENTMIKLLKKTKNPKDWLLAMEAVVLKNRQDKNIDNYSATAIFLKGRIKGQMKSEICKNQHYIKTKELHKYNIRQLHQLITASGIHQGTRKYQEDALYIGETVTFTDKDKALIMGIVCDGMGGLQNGAEASKITVETAKQNFWRQKEILDMTAFFRSTILQANRQVNILTNSDGGTTLVMVVIDHNKLYWASVGDSRIYILRKGEIACLTRDHNYLITLMEQVKRKKISLLEAQTHPKKDALISYIGMEDLELIDICQAPFTLKTGDVVLLCSDGLTKTLSDSEIANIIFSKTSFSKNNSIGEIARRLPIEVYDRSVKAQDNIAVVLIQYK